MASSSSSTPPPAPSAPLPHRSCIRAFYLNAATSSAVLDVARAVKHDQEASGQHFTLAAWSLGEAKDWSLVSISSSSWAKVSDLRTQLIRESDSLIPIVTSINPSALYLYENAMVIQLHAGVAPVKNFVTMDRDCGLLVPLSPISTAVRSEDEDDRDGDESSAAVMVTAWDETRGDDTYYRLALAEGKAFVVSGTAKLRVEGPEPLVAVVFCLASGSGMEG